MIDMVSVLVFLPLPSSVKAIAEILSAIGSPWMSATSISSGVTRSTLVPPLTAFSMMVSMSRSPSVSGGVTMISAMGPSLSAAVASAPNVWLELSTM